MGLVLFFMVAVLAYSYMAHGGVPNSAFLAVGALFGAYMAINIGTNDVANAIGLLAAIADAVQTSAISAKAPITIWVMMNDQRLYALIKSEVGL